MFSGSGAVLLPLQCSQSKTGEYLDLRFCVSKNYNVVYFVIFNVNGVFSGCQFDRSEGERPAGVS